VSLLTVFPPAFVMIAGLQIIAVALGLWTHLVSDGRFILSYNADMRAGATARIDDDGVLQDQQDITQVAIGLWTHLVA
jgi:hypothetical protein